MDSSHSDKSSLISGNGSDSPEFDSFAVVEETITRLYRLSSAIKKSGSHYRDLRAELYVELESLYGTVVDQTERFLEHFAKKVIRYRVPARVIDGESEPIAELWLQERLARTIAKRRNRFLYWRRRHQKMLENSSYTPNPSIKPVPAASRVGSQAVLNQTLPKEGSAEGQETKSIAGTEDTGYTPIDQTRFRKIAASSKSSNTSAVSSIWKNKDEIPGPPRFDSANTHFMCPLCFTHCEAKEAEDKHWRYGNSQSNKFKRANKYIGGI